MSAPTPAGEHDYPAAAALLGVSEDWLRTHTPKGLPHLKKSLGKRGRGAVTFTDAHIKEIKQMFERRPAAPAAMAPVTRRRRSA